MEKLSGVKKTINAETYFGFCCNLKCDRTEICFVDISGITNSNLFVQNIVKKKEFLDFN